MMLPNYMQIHGLTTTLGGRVRPFWLRVEKGRWAPDIEEMKKLVTRKTAAIAICNPNNPTGSTLTTQEMKAIAETAEDLETVVISDEVYQGAELEGPVTPTMFDLSDRVIVTNSLSKAYGLPGLRIGWAVTHSKEHADMLWSYSDYATISPSMLSDRLATIALQPEKRSMILNRTRTIIKEHWQVVKEWLDQRKHVLSYIAPNAASLCFPKHSLKATSMDIVERLLKEKSVLLIPGEHFGMPGYLRIGFGHDVEKLRKGLGRIDEVFDSMKSSH
jgi:hypothetical protein